MSRRAMGGTVKYLLGLGVFAICLASAPAATAVAESGSAADAWTAATAEFKLQMHALAGEALILQLKTSAAGEALPSKTSRKIRFDAKRRLSDSLWSANAILSMLEIAEHSDRGPRVREVVVLWLDSSRTAVGSHLESAEAVTADAPLDAGTAEFLEELKILWRRLDRAYADLLTTLGPSPLSAGAPEAVQE